MSKKSPHASAPTSTLILLVRHGQTSTTGKVLPGRAAGLHLSETGRAEAENVAHRLSELKKVAAIYASPLERARETAAPIAEALKQKVRIHKGLLECDFGDWTGAKLAALMKKPEWKTIQVAPSTFRFPNGESFTEMQNRVVNTLDDIRTKHRGQVVVCVSHADPIKSAIAHSIGTHLDLFQRIVISTCSVSAISVSAYGPLVLGVNLIGGSLSELRPS